MAIHEFHPKLANLRLTSRWPDQEDFASQVGLSLGGYRKYETGERIPSLKVLQQIFERASTGPKVAAELLQMRNDAWAEKAGITTPLGQTHAVSSDALAKRIGGEVMFVLKQAGTEVKGNTRSVLEKRVAMILKSALGV